MINRVNPRRKLVFEFPTAPVEKEIEKLSSKYNFRINEKILRAELPDKELTQLVSELFQLSPPVSFTFEDLPVEDTMRSFFTHPKQFLE